MKAAFVEAIQQRNIRGSEAARDTILHRFVALRLWSGCSSLFFTLNPHDISSPLTLLFLQEDYTFGKRFSLDLSDAETDAYLSELLKDDPLLLHRLVAANPLAATRCFHWTVRIVVRTLFNVIDPSCRSSDSVFFVFQT